MIIQVNTDKHIKSTEGLENFINEKLRGTLKHQTSHITRIEVHLSDQNADKGGSDDVQCKLEARIENRKPVTVVGQSDSKEKAINEAAVKMKSALSSIIGKMKNK